MEEITMFGIAGLPAILIICLLAGIAVKNIRAINDKWIPVICGVLGGILGAVGMNVMPEFPASNYISAVAVGIVSGLAATGAHQIYKQFTKNDLQAQLDYYKSMAQDNENCYLQAASVANELREKLYPEEEEKNDG